MSAGIYNFTLDQGATWNLEVLYKDSAGAVINLTGYDAALQIRKAYDTDEPVLELDSDGNGIVITANLGKLAITASAADTADIAPGDYVYDLEISSGSVVTRIIQGTVHVSPEVTRAE